MSGARIRLVLALGLFLAWTGWLIYEAATNSDPVVVSRPQLLMAAVVVEADVPALEVREIRVRQVYRGQRLLGLPADQAESDLALAVADLSRAQGWAGPGRYLLLLHQPSPGTYALVPVPVSPGFPPLAEADRLKPRIYPVTDSIRKQVIGYLAGGP